MNNLKLAAGKDTNKHKYFVAYPQYEKLLKTIWSNERIFDVLYEYNIDIGDYLNGTESTKESKLIILQILIGIFGWDVNYFVLNEQGYIDVKYINFNTYYIAIGLLDNIDMVGFKQYKDLGKVAYYLLKDRSLGIDMVPIMQNVYGIPLDDPSALQCYSLMYDRYRRRYLIPDSYPEIQSNWMYVEDEEHLEAIKYIYDNNIDLQVFWTSYFKQGLVSQVKALKRGITINQLNKQYSSYDNKFIVEAIVRYLDEGVDIRPYLFKSSSMTWTETVYLILKYLPVFKNSINKLPDLSGMPRFLKSNKMTLEEKFILLSYYDLDNNKCDELAENGISGLRDLDFELKYFSYDFLCRVRNYLQETNVSQR